MCSLNWVKDPFRNSNREKDGGGNLKNNPVEAVK